MLVLFEDIMKYDTYSVSLVVLKFLGFRFNYKDTNEIAVLYEVLNNSRFLITVCTQQILYIVVLCYVEAKKKRMIFYGSR